MEFLRDLWRYIDPEIIGIGLDYKSVQYAVGRLRRLQLFHGPFQIRTNFKVAKSRKKEGKNWGVKERGVYHSSEKKNLVKLSGCAFVQR